jgi:predicted Zn finger-like uncharacterized protein
MTKLIRECPSCSRKVRVPDELLGKMVKCPTCGHTFAATQPSPAAPGASVSGTTSALTGLAAPPETDAAETLSHVQAPSSSVPTPVLSPCPSCHQLIPDSAKRCPHCDAEIEDDEGQTWEAGSAPSGRRDAEPHRGNTVLVMGILSLVIPWIGLILGIAAIVMGRRDLVKMRGAMMDRDGQSVTQAGWICGIIGTCLQTLACAGCGVYIAFVIAVATAMVRQQGIGPPMGNPPNVAPMPPQAPPAAPPKKI